MKREQEPKYTAAVSGGEARLYNRLSGEPIPDDEPVFVFRARDVHAASVIAHYSAMCGDTDHQKAVMQRYHDFRRFAREHPERMKEPDTWARTGPK